MTPEYGLKRGWTLHWAILEVPVFWQRWCQKGGSRLCKHWLEVKSVTGVGWHTAGRMERWLTSTPTSVGRGREPLGNLPWTWFVSELTENSSAYWAGFKVITYYHHDYPLWVRQSLTILCPHFSEEDPKLREGITFPYSKLKAEPGVHNILLTPVDCVLPREGESTDSTSANRNKWLLFPWHPAAWISILSQL